MERLAHVTFGDCPPETRDKLAASQFISSLANEEMKRTLRLGGFKSLSATVLRAQEIEAVESDLQPSLQNEARYFLTEIPQEVWTMLRSQPRWIRKRGPPIAARNAGDVEGLDICRGTVSSRKERKTREIRSRCRRTIIDSIPVDL